MVSSFINTLLSLATIHLCCITVAVSMEESRHEVRIRRSNEGDTRVHVDFTPPDDRNMFDLDHFDLYFDNDEVTSFAKVHTGETNDHHFVGVSDVGDTLHLISDEGSLTGSAVMGTTGTVYQFRPDAYGNNFVTAKKSTDFHHESHDGGEAVNGKDVRRLRSRQQQAQALLPQTRRLQERELNIIVVWTKKAECRNSGLSDGCDYSDTTQRNMQQLVDLSIAESNIAFRNSGANVKLKLVHSFRELDYVENNNMGDSLFYLWNKIDGKMDYIHDMRVQYRAHFVSLIMHTDERLCGRGNYGYPTPSSIALFSAVQWDCASGQYSFGHEIGHNIGCDHDRAWEKQCSASRTNFGYINYGSGYRDIMSTECSTTGCDGSAPGWCTRKQFFSTDSSSATFGLMGDQSNNCVSHINDSVEIIYNMFPEVQPTTSPSKAPTKAPTLLPTAKPTEAPTPLPTKWPTMKPSLLPSAEPSVTTTVCGNGFCELGETCATCPLDCSSGSFTLAKCGNGICEAGDGEDHFNCPYDCRGDAAKQYFCGVNGRCDSAECSKGSFSCTTASVGVVESCCGDGSCSMGESDKTCSLDCMS